MQCVEYVGIQYIQQGLGLFFCDCVNCGEGNKPTLAFSRRSSLVISPIESTCGQMSCSAITTQSLLEDVC